jgi:hypothetical protein
MILKRFYRFWASLYRTSAPYPCRAWETYLGIYTLIPFLVIIAAAFASRTGMVSVTSAWMRWYCWVMGIYLATMVVAHVVLKRAELRLCRLNKKGLRCWDCQYLVEKGFGDQCSECGMSIETSRALWSEYKPLSLLNHPGGTLKWKARVEARAKKS